MQINGGADFSTLAREKSIDPTGRDGGYLGRMSIASLRPELRDALQGVVAIDGKALRGAYERGCKATPLHLGNVWAADARTGRELWHYQYPPNSGSTIGNRGVGMYGNWLFFETPDSNLVSVDAATGRQNWRASTERRLSACVGAGQSDCADCYVKIPAFKLRPVGNLQRLRV